jgi:predicted TIM-barrel fold metal-dependent hydrolase
MNDERDDDKLALPFPLSDVSNGEWSPRPANEKQRAVAKLLAEESERRAKRLGISRREFLRSAAGTATAFMCMNIVHGLPSIGDAAVLPVTDEQCDDPAAARELFEADDFVMDVQIHHVDLEQYGDVPELGCLRFRPPEQTCTAEGLQMLSQANMVKEVFVDSETAVGVISGVPNGYPLPVETMAQTRDLVNSLAGSQRALSQAMCDPLSAPGSSTAIDSLEHQVNDLGAVALKTYTGNGNWWLDDEAVAYPMLEECARLGLDIINVHKGFPAILGPGAEEYVKSRDLPKVVADWPEMSFVAYHSGYFPGAGITEFIDATAAMPRIDKRRLYAEIGSAFAVAFTQSPLQAAHLLGQLMNHVGRRNILWGTDSIWWGSPQWQIDAFKALVIPNSLRDVYGYRSLSKGTKRRILGRNAAKLYRIKVNEARCVISEDQLSAIKAELGGDVRKHRTHLVYGPRSEAAYRQLIAHAGQPPADKGAVAV